MASFTPNDNTLSNAPHPDDIDIAPRICGYYTGKAVKGASMSVQRKSRSG
ncbi:predicted protein [Pyrenophora tritici-repentis Pt-1C-BFP]|uniref:Uncharacterized protein n=1 Tax=Pyrenophora tritici-repentis (strain Pt-1C-BFP) TaxID=426418 RepID=B2WLX6_PYRTR|nr:uncharacterized protein PTRG_10986 [Pyrenophora tritici-repentis Pt-1C-BFP]EDU44036.1 predicted protein [Pyrenophora tritici-repentis Pt-1C-BFP]